MNCDGCTCWAGNVNSFRNTWFHPMGGISAGRLVSRNQCTILHGFNNVYVFSSFSAASFTPTVTMTSKWVCSLVSWCDCLVARSHTRSGLWARGVFVLCWRFSSLHAAWVMSVICQHQGMSGTIWHVIQEYLLTGKTCDRVVTGSNDNNKDNCK